MEPRNRNPRTAQPGARRGWWRNAVGWLGLVAHAATAYLYAGAGLVAPLPGLAVLWLLWLVLLACALWLLARHPALTPLVPLASVAVLFGGLALGGALFGWTA